MHTRPPELPTSLQPTSQRTAELDRLGDEIAELSAHLDAATARLLTLIREFDVRGGWNTGFRSCAEWLAWRVGLAPGSARERVRVARALEALPAMTAALGRGQLSYAKVRALTRIATPETEARLLAVARAGTAVHVERIVQGWRQVDRQAEARNAARQHAGRALHVHSDSDGTVVLRLPEPRRPHGQRPGTAPRANRGRARDAALSRPARPGHPPAAAAGSASPPPDRMPAARGRDAAGRASRGPRRARAQATPPPPAQIAPAAQVGQSLLEDGPHVPAGTSQRLACDASRVVMRHGEDGQVVEIGARTRTIPPALRRALHHRDRSCRFPGCNVRVGEGHHVRHWAQGGPTTLSNLALLCRRHHRSVHEDGYQIDREPDGTLKFRRPDGRLLPEVPSLAPLPADPVAALRAQHVAQGLQLHARTGLAGWLGERLDVGWAIDVLHPLASRAAR